MSDTVFIYALKCPVTDEIRYVGKTNNPTKRYAGPLRAKERDHRGNWIRSVMATGGKPILEILDEVPDAEWPMWEVAYIQFFREEGCSLVNATCGGEGVEMTGETRAKIGAANSGENCSAETRAKIGAAKSGEKNPNFGKLFSPETRAKLSAAKSGEKHPLFGKKHSPEHCAKISAANSGKHRSSETRAKMKAAWVLRKERYG